MSHPIRPDKYIKMVRAWDLAAKAGLLAWLLLCFFLSCLSYAKAMDACILPRQTDAAMAVAV